MQSYKLLQNQRDHLESPKEDLLPIVLLNGKRED